MRESPSDLNHLLYLHQIALIQADAALDEPARHMHLRIARTYADEITRRTEGRVRLGRAAVRLVVEDSPIAPPMRVLVPA